MELLEPLPVFLGIAVVRERAIAGMSPNDAPSVLDWTPILLGAPGDLANVSDQSVGVRAVGAVELFEGVQIGKVMAVEYQIIAAVHLRDSIHRKTDTLVNRDKEIEQHERNDYGIDHRRSQDHQRACIQQIGGEACSQLAMAAQDFLFEEDPASFQPYAKLGSALRQFRFELGLQNLDFWRQCHDFGIHRNLPVAGSLKHSTRGVALFVELLRLSSVAFVGQFHQRNSRFSISWTGSFNEILRKFVRLAVYVMSKL